MLLKIKKGIPMNLDDDDNPTFERWMLRVDELVWRSASCSVHDLPDCAYQSWYAKRLRPVRAAQRALRLAGDLD